MSQGQEKTAGSPGQGDPAQSRVGTGADVTGKERATVRCHLGSASASTFGIGTKLPLGAEADLRPDRATNAAEDLSWPG